VNNTSWNSSSLHESHVIELLYVDLQHFNN